MKILIVKLVRLAGRGLVRWLELLGENPPLSRHCWPGPHIAEELAERARRRALAAEERRALAAPGEGAAVEGAAGAGAAGAGGPRLPPGDGSGRQPRRVPPRHLVHRRLQRRAQLLGC